MAGVSAAIAAIPEEPPVLLAVILGLGAYRLLRRDVLVRRLNAQETLGAVDLILTDKTGTLTLNRLEVLACDARGGARRTGGAGARRRAAGGSRCVAGGDGVAPGAFTAPLRARSKRPAATV